ncbi:MAG: alpha/beta fold hydrolase [Ilumatobacter fluminis]|jgi:3-oxoadipate enol-lactonase|uniref:alpha/beta fold hydrolase n=1 Tax=Ilumatobacter fluminis TaxID=467091 RepID=UPI0032EC3A0E
MPYIRSSDGIRLHYRESGRRSGPPVLMIQGLGADKHGWDLQRLALAPNYHTIALDNRGAGRSDKPYGAYSLEQMADDAIAVLDAVGVERAHVIGASMGGAITQIIGIRHPERVRSLTLACTACQHHPWRRELLAEWAEIAQTRGVGAMTAQAARWVIGPRSFRRLTPAIGWMGPLALARPPHAFASQVAGILSIDDELKSLLPSIDVPTLVIVGNQDILTPRGDSEQLADLIPTAELVVVSGAAHGFMIEHATTFNRVMLDFLGRAEQAFVDRTAESDDDVAARSVG